MSEDVIIRNLNVRNPWYSQNGDGLDLESCKNVLIYNNTFEVGDDAMCFKSGKDMKKIIISIWMMLGLVYKKVGSRTLKLEVFSPIQSKSPCLGIVMIYGSNLM